MTHPLLGEFAAPAAGGFGAAGVLGLVTLALLLAYLVCLGLREAWGHTVGYGLRAIANQIEGISVGIPWVGSIHPFGEVARVMRWADHVVAHALAVAALNTESSAVTFFHLTATVFWWTVHETADGAVDTFHAIEHLVTHRIPDAAKWARREAVQEAKRLVNREAALRLARDVVLGSLVGIAGANAIRALRAAAHALDWSESHVGHIGREIEGIRARLRHIERLLTPAGVVGLVIAALGSLGLGALRCPGFLRLLNKHGCGLGGLLEGLLGLVISALALENVCTLLPILESAFGEVVGPVTHLLTEVPLGGCEKPPKEWAKLSVAVGPLPPPQTLGALPV